MKVTFISTIIVGFIAHAYMMTNKLPNYDDFYCMVDNYGTDTESGRWMLFILGSIVGRTVRNFSLPWFNGLITLVMIGIAASLIVEIFQLKDNIICFLTGAIMVSFPSVAGILFFMFTAMYYSISILFSVISVFCIRKCKYGLIWGTIFLTSSMGIYQAYVSFTSAMLLALLLWDCISENADKKIIAIRAIKYLLLLISSLLIYLVLTRFFLFITQTNLTDYQGIDTMGKVDIFALPQQVFNAYRIYFGLLYKNTYSVNPYWVVKIPIVIFHIIILVLLIWKLTRKNKVIILESLIFLSAFPLAINALCILTPNTYIYTPMVYSIVSVYLLTLIILEKTLEQGKPFASRIIDRCIQWISIGMLFIIVFAQCQYNNVQYLAMTVQYEQAYSYLTTMVSEIKSCDGYQSSMKIVMIGKRIQDPTFYYNDEFADYNIGGREQYIINSYSRNEFLKRYLGFNQQILEDTNMWGLRPEVKAMKFYPDEGSIKIIEDTIIVKVSDS